jgi:hypothetical protein
MFTTALFVIEKKIKSLQIIEHHHTTKKKKNHTFENYLGIQENVQEEPV